VRVNENLFNGDADVYDNLESLSTISVPHCTCTEDGKSECSYSSFTSCNDKKGKEYKCNIENKTGKKLANASLPHTSRKMGEARNIDYVQTEEYAKSLCIQSFQASPEYELCQNRVTDLTNITMSNCIEDIKMTGDDNLTQIHVEAALQQCTSFVLLNSTLQESDPEITNIVQNLCPNNCSNNGVCKAGNCTCLTGFGGSDCSFDLLEPPTITDVPSAGLCDLSTKSCMEATIIGKYFFENMDSRCYLEIHQVSINQSTIRTENKRTGLEERTLFEGFCPLQYSTDGVWTTEIKFSISNNDVLFTEKFTIHVFQSSCQEYHNDSGRVYFTLKDDHCYIDSTCMRPMENNSRNICQYCNASNQKYEWTEKQNCKTNETSGLETTTVTEHIETTDNVQHVTTLIPNTDNNHGYSAAYFLHFSTMKYFPILWTGLLPLMHRFVMEY
ncbi:von Willebrand factor D and EGF domain-containing protein-like, partial [Saccostrea cucullata]|uniref:von Willebrand factor D and EGF domain-containing protein-like n=1 Tax=Saccostrea cuccullata TaxID=36930 RepID=UPI002ED3EEE4